MSMEELCLKDLEKRIVTEKKRARERFESLINLVNSRYRNPESTISKNENLIESYEVHNSEVLDSAIELGMMMKGLNNDDFMALEIAAILHDINKTDLPSEESKGIKNFVLTNHHEMAAGEVENILKNNSEIFDLASDSQGKAPRADKIVGLVKNAILCHMGPNPGFMADTLKKVNEELEKRGLPKIVHPKPNDNISKILFASDMRALASSGGIQKVLNLRASYFVEKDKELCAEYKKIGLELSVPEAALISASQSARDAVATVKDTCGEEGSRWIQATFDLAKKSDFVYSRGGEKTEVVFQTIEEKMKKFEELKKSTSNPHNS